MGWKGVTVMDQKVGFIAEYLRDCLPFNELCLQFSISRKTGYKWVGTCLRSEARESVKKRTSVFWGAARLRALRVTLSSFGSMGGQTSGPNRSRGQSMKQPAPAEDRGILGCT
jgi:putative transposase